MIMPADPKVGDVYRPENIPGLVFEEVTVKAIDKTLDGPLGPIDGGLVVEELHMDGTTEDKTFAPGYGEFYTAGGGDVEALALAVPTDAASGPNPAELATLSNGALDVFDAAQSEDWNAASATVEKMSAAWETYRAGEVPKLIEPRMNDALASLAEAVDARDAAQAQQAAFDAAQWSLDLQLRYRPLPRSTSPASTSGPPSSRRRGGRGRGRSQRRSLHPRLHPGPDPAHAGRCRPPASTPRSRNSRPPWTTRTSPQHPMPPSASERSSGRCRERGAEDVS